MWRVIMTGLLYIVVVEARPMEQLEGPLWSFTPPEVVLRRHPEAQRSQRNFHQSVYNPDADYDLILPQFSQTKRAITMFSRWSPISSIGKQRTPIRSNPNTFSNNQIRDRQHGQPLRWG